MNELSSGAADMNSSAGYFILYIFVRMSEHLSPELVVLCRRDRKFIPAGSHRLTAALNSSSSILTCRLSPVMQKKQEKKPF